MENTYIPTQSDDVYAIAPKTHSHLHHGSHNIVRPYREMRFPTFLPADRQRGAISHLPQPHFHFNKLAWMTELSGVQTRDSDIIQKTVDNVIPSVGVAWSCIRDKVLYTYGTTCCAGWIFVLHEKLYKYFQYSISLMHIDRM